MPLNPSFSDLIPPPVNLAFMVPFYGIGAIPIPNPLDIRFQKVSGIGIVFVGSSQPVQEGSQHGHSQSLPGRPTYPKLI